MANIRVYPYLSPRIVEVLAPDTEVSVQELINLIRDWEDSEDGMPFEYIISAAGKEELGSGVTVGITATLNNAQIRFTGRTAPIDNGTATVGDSDGRVLTDNTAQFVTDGVIYTGCTLLNSTTGDQETITNFTETTITTFPISGALSSGWTIGDSYLVYPNVQCNIGGGNLVAVDENGNSISSVLQSPNVQIIRTSSSSATLQELEAIQFSSFAGGITVDIDNISGNATSGIIFPAGTREAPSNNIQDANTIANIRGFSTFYIIGHITLNNASINLQDNIFIGESANKSIITIDDNADIYRCEFRDATINGILDGDSIIKDCIIGDINYFSGIIYTSMLTSTILLGYGASAHMLNCYSGVPGEGTPIVDLGGSGQSLAMRNYNGGIKLTNKNGSESVSLDLASGQIKLTKSITNGTILCRGVGQITEDFSKGAVIRDSMIDSSQRVKPPGGLVRVNS